METTSSLKFGLSHRNPAQHERNIVNDSRYFQSTQKHQNNNLKNMDLEPHPMLGQNHGPFTLIIMRP